MAARSGGAGRDCQGSIFLPLQPAATLVFSVDWGLDTLLDLHFFISIVAGL